VVALGLGGFEPDDWQQDLALGEIEAGAAHVAAARRALAYLDAVAVPPRKP